MTPRVRLVLHQKRIADDVVRAIVAKARAEGLSIDVRVTWESGDAEAIAYESARLGVTTILAGGGDGTLNEVVSGVHRSGRAHRCTVGLLPLGTANDFALASGLPVDPGLAFEVVRTSPATLVDLGRVNGRTFVNVATGGFSAKVSRLAPEAIKKLLGKAAYLLTGLLHLEEVGAQHAVFRGPSIYWQGEFLGLGVGNARTAGGGLPVCPTALIDDGALDVAVLPSLGGNDPALLLETLATSGFSGLEQKVQRARVPWLEIESEDDIHLNVDGEPITARTLRFDVVPRAIRMHLPEGSALVGSPGRTRHRRSPRAVASR